MTADVTDWTGLEVLDADESMALVQSVPIGRLAMIDAGEIVVLPVNHAVVDGRVAFRTAAGAKLDAAVMQHVVAFEADAYDVDTHSGWSVIIKGRADIVTDDETLAKLRDSGVRPWSNPTVRSNWVVVNPREISGRRVAAVD